MIKFSLSSHHKVIRSFLYVLLCFTLLVVSVNIFFSFILDKKIKEASSIVAETDGFSMGARFAYFNVLSGITITGLELGRGGEPIFSSSRLDIGFDALSLLKRQVLVKNVSFYQPRIYLNKTAELASLVKQILPKLDKSIGFFPTTYFRGWGLSLDDTVQLDIQGYASCVRGNIMITRGTLLLKKAIVPAFSDIDLLNGSNFYRPFDYVFEIESGANDLKISRLEISNPALKFTGGGSIEDFLKVPRMSFEMNFLNIMLDDFPVLNSEHLKSGGAIDAVFKASGPIEDMDTSLSLKISNAYFAFFDSLFIDRVNGSAFASRDHIDGKGLALSINGMPFIADFAIYQQGSPRIQLELSSKDPKLAMPAFVLKLAAGWLNKELSGDVKATMRYASKDTSNTLDFKLNKFRLGYDDDLFINANELAVAFTAESNDPHKEAKVANRTLFFEHLFAIIRRQKEGFMLDNLKSMCYGGTLEGLVNFVPKNESIQASGEIHLRDVDLDEFFLRSPEVQHVLSGKLAGDLRFDTGKSDMFKGQVFIAGGVVEQNPLLNAVSDFLGVASLKRIAFDDLSLFFTGGRGEYSSQVKLLSPKVNGLLDGKISSYDKMDGILSIHLATQLLNESRQFKKILTYIKHDEPSVLFAFKISSYLNSPRVLWLKNEFKEKLQNLLPERNKRFLQRQVNSMVENIKAE